VELANAAKIWLSLSSSLLIIRIFLILPIG
jgi:hypothetical protein